MPKKPLYTGLAAALLASCSTKAPEAPKEPDYVAMKTMAEVRSSVPKKDLDRYDLLLSCRVETHVRQTGHPPDLTPAYAGKVAHDVRKGLDVSRECARNG